MDNTERLRQANRDIETEIGKLMLSLPAGTIVECRGEWHVSNKEHHCSGPSLLATLRTFKGLN